MSKDPAVLFYISDWLTSTKEMRADERGWYLNLILHQYDKGDLPNNVEELANLADVRFSEFDNFKQRWEQVLKQKFEENKNGRLENSKAKKILQGRAQFKEKRSNSGRIGYVIKFAKSNICNENEYIEYIKKNFDFENTTINDKQVLKQVLKHLLKLYRNENENENENEGEDINIKKEFKSPDLQEVKRYFREWGYSEKAAERAFNYYQANDWHDSKGNKVKSWKQKMQGMWFKKENAITNQKPVSPAYKEFKG